MENYKGTSKELLRTGRERENTIRVFGFNLWRHAKAAPNKEWHHISGRKETMEEPVIKGVQEILNYQYYFTNTLGSLFKTKDTKAELRWKYMNYVFNLTAKDILFLYKIASKRARSIFSSFRHIISGLLAEDVFV